MEKKTYYITTPIYYPSGKWHIGHCYTTVSCDALARFKRMQGYDVFFLTGTDEHGQKVEKVASAKGLTPKEYVDERVADLKNIWKILNISYDKFIRTTDDYHVKSIQKIFEKLYEKGDIYKSEYEGAYCAPCESFWTETQLIDGKCPDCGREVTREKEESYFFKLSKYADRLVEYYKEHECFVEPKSRLNEMINNFIKPGLTDLCVSRTTIKWGIPVSFDKKHSVYVWIDALCNYLTALGYMGEDDSLMKKYWPADLQMVGKEIVRFHTIIWPALLMALDLPLPNKVFGHGWLLIGGDKLSKSKLSNVKTELVEPAIISERYGSDALRYYLLREIPFGSDGSYTNESFFSRVNSDLANDLGNLVQRTIAMINKYFDGELKSPDVTEDIDKELIDKAKGLYEKVESNLSKLLIPQALGDIFDVVRRANKYIDETMPWKLGANAEGTNRLKTVLYNLAETIRICAVMLRPFLPKTSSEILKKLSINEEINSFADEFKFGKLTEGTKVFVGNPIFPRIDIKKEEEEIEKLYGNREEKVKEAKKDMENQNENGIIKIDDFAKIQLKTAKVIAAEKIAKSEKLLKLQLEIGNETRQVVSGIAKHYTADEMVGKTVVVVYNLAPCKLCGELSQGMILCAEDENGTLSLVSPEKSILSGGTVR